MNETGICEYCGEPIELLLYSDRTLAWQGGSNGNPSYCDSAPATIGEDSIPRWRHEPLPRLAVDLTDLDAVDAWLRSSS